jgi:predicted HAD superfamily phosphohydrolase
MSGLGYSPRDMNVEELLVHHEPVIVAGQFNQALRRLQEVFDELVEHDLQGARRLIELVHLVAGNRRVKVIEVSHNRRTT